MQVAEICAAANCNTSQLNHGGDLIFLGRNTIDLVMISGMRVTIEKNTMKAGKEIIQQGEPQAPRGRCKPLETIGFCAFLEHSETT